MASSMATQACQGVRPPVGRHKVGIALIVSNDYRGTSRPELPGTDKDARTMYDAFSFLGYDIVLRRNITRDNFLAECKTLAGYDYSSNGCKRIVVIFSGHGLEQKLILQDDKVVTMDELVSTFKPLSSGNVTLANTVRMFFIDACRGNDTDPGISQSLLSRSPRGGRFDGRVSSEAGIIIAYSTTEQHRAFEDPAKGGLWMQYLAQELRTSDKGLQTVLTDTNNKLTKHFENSKHSFQTAQFTSQLTKDVYLLKERPSIPQLVVQFPSLNDTTTSTTTVQPAVTSTDVPEDVPVNYTGSIDPNPPTLNEVPPPASSSDDTMDTSIGSSQSQLREVLTAQGITCQYQITETPSGMDGRPWYSCELNCHYNGVTYKFRSRQSYRDRDEAKQDVNKQALAEPNIGHSELFSRSVVESYQEKLLAYCSKKGYRSPSYSAQTRGNGYVSSVLVPRNGKYGGEVAADLDKAKESAAKQALRDLGEIHFVTEII